MNTLDLAVIGGGPGGYCSHGARQPGGCEYGCDGNFFKPVPGKSCVGKD